MFRAIGVFAMVALAFAGFAFAAAQAQRFVGCHRWRSDALNSIRQKLLASHDNLRQPCV